MSRFDLCVIGSGPAGQKAAIQASKVGKRVCVVDKKEMLGGVALHTGTIPSKALREAILRLGGRSEAMPTVQDFRGARHKTFLELGESTDAVVRAETDIVRGHFVSNGIEMVVGTARFVDPYKVEVVSERRQSTILADRFVIAVGTRPAMPANIPFDGTNVLSSDDLVKLDYLPHSIIVVGGGVIGTEYASMLNILGLKTTLVEGRARVLDFVDSELVEALQYHLRQAGMTLRLGEKVTRVEVVDPPDGARSINDHMVEATLESGKTLRADAMLYCIGRQGATESLNLDAIGVETDSRGRISVNDHYQTSAEHVYACGDVIGFPALASTSMEQGRLAACHMFGVRCESVKKELLPYGIYTIPEISMVGWTEEQLTQEGIPFDSGVAQYREIARGKLLGDDIGMLKMLIHQDSHAILGVHVIGTGATELVHIGQCAIAFNATVEYFVDAVFNYPTLAECYKVAALNGLNKIKSV